LRNRQQKASTGRRKSRLPHLSKATRSSVRASRQALLKELEIIRKVKSMSANAKAATADVVKDAPRFEVKIHTDRCIAAGHCVAAAQEVFDQNETSGIVELLKSNPHPSLYAAVKEAVHKCPTAAIEIIEK